ncbi:unnamed protein product [Anisakis simplex]|uniref:Helicase SKI2W (inferred by orthology to a human protein) n=1 Tax=Anisakis simplex TaxID=6269 RepID=A0A0M3K3Y9_ANISI|nr:unnamed protein product [Anisakis simplex]
MISENENDAVLPNGSDNRVGASTREQLDAQIFAESSEVFRSSAVEALTKCCPKYDLSSTYELPEPDSDVTSLFKDLINELPSTYDLKAVLNDETGQVESFEEVWNSEVTQIGNAKTSLSLNRLPDPNAHANVIGISGNLPFMPGGFEEEIDNVLRLNDIPTVTIDDQIKGIHQTERMIEDILKSNDGTSGDLFNEPKSEDIRMIEAIVYGEDYSVRTGNEESEGAKSTESQSAEFFDLENADIFELIDFVGQGTQMVNSAEENKESDDKKMEDDQNKNDGDGNDKAATSELHAKGDVDYPFELDMFQQKAVVCMEKGESVFVAAHTSAGKTVVAEYAVALSSINRTRVIYTSPIKALSNQKFRDFKMVFDEVGLITGDIQLHTDAFALVMTTEVLRSMLYNGSEVIRELEWVIFDEVHYINDVERGHVWEEVLIMLPGHVKIVMLSATVPNCVEFADWSNKESKDQRSDDIKTSSPTGTLFVHGSGREDPKGSIQSCRFERAIHNERVTDKNIYTNLIEHLRTQNLLPMVVFVFSRRRKTDFTRILCIYSGTLVYERYSLQKVLQMAELCQRGFAVHHSGILPILKEVVELLFQKGYVKILFATETFAMGVNMPARTVVFDSMQKHDGRELRTLSPSEYIQMAGRAGRRGLDSTGTVIVLCKGTEAPEPTELIRMMLGKAMKLESKFRVTYSMLLNLLRVEHLRIEDMLQRSYVESASLRLALSRKATLKKVETTLAQMPPLECDICCKKNDRGSVDDGTDQWSIEEYYMQLRDFVRFRSELWTDLIRYPVVDKMLSLGRLVIVALPEIGRQATLGIIMKVQSEGQRKVMQLMISVEDDPNLEERDRQRFEAFSKLPEKEREWKRESAMIEGAALIGLERLQIEKKGSSRRTYRLVNDVAISSLLAICQKQIKIDIGAVVTDARIRNGPRFRTRSPDPAISKIIIELDSLTEKWTKQNADGPNVVLPGRDLQITDVEIYDKIMNLNVMRNMLIDYKRYPCRSCVSFQQHVLNRLGYTDDSNLVTLKGKVACEIHHQELLVTELMLDNKFETRTMPEIAAMLSAMTCQYKERNNDSQKGSPTNGAPAALHQMNFITTSL